MASNPHYDHITFHAIQRYQERVEDVPAIEVVRRLSTPNIMGALKLGKATIKLPTGHRAEIVDGHILTVKNKKRIRPCSRK